MISVGIRELKNRLSEYLRMVRRGEEISVTDRGEAVAELRQPVNAPGIVAYPDLYPRMASSLPPGTARRLLDAERGER